MIVRIVSTLPAKLHRAGLLCLLLLPMAAPVRGAEPEKAGKPEAAKPAAATPESPLDAEISTLRAGIKTTPGDALLHARLGYLLLNKGALDEAKQAFDEALKLNPRSHAAMTGEGIILARQGKLREAEKVLKDALVENPNPVRTHYELGLVYEKLGELDKAIAEYKAALAKYQQGRK